MWTFEFPHSVWIMGLFMSSSLSAAIESLVAIFVTALERNFEVEDLHVLIENPLLSEFFLAIRLRTFNLCFKMRTFMRLQFSSVSELQRAICTFLLVMQVFVCFKSSRAALWYEAHIADE
jgi:hypothetical protein